MFTLIIVALLGIAVILAMMAWVPGFKDLVANKWGVVGVALLAILAWLAQWFNVVSL